MPNRLLFEAFKKGTLKEFQGYDFVRPEFTYGHSRFDFLLQGKDGKCLIEAGSVTYS